MKTLVVSDVTRPNIFIEENNGHLTGTQYWSAVKFKVPNIKTKDVVGKYDKIQIKHNNEIWEFSNANVMLNNAIDDFSMTYDGVWYKTA